MRDLRYFLAVADELSFTRAADRLHVSQPALSKQVRALEARLGTELFARGHRSIELTAAGTRLLPRARGIVDEWEHAAAEVRAVAGTARRTITVGFHTRIGRGLVPGHHRRARGADARLAAALPPGRLGRPERRPARRFGRRGGGLAAGPGPRNRPPGRGDRGAMGRAAGRATGWPHARPSRSTSWPRAVRRPARLGRGHARVLAGRGPAPVTPARVGTEADTADEAFEAVASGLGVVLLAAGNAAIYRRDDVVCRPVPDLPPCELAVMWRADDHRGAVRVVTDACCRCVAGGAGG